MRELRDSGEELDVQQAAEILLQLVAALDVHDRITRGHAERVRGYAASLGRQIGLSEDDLDRLNWSALLHDVGKLEIDAEILNRPGRPTDDEWKELRRHPLAGELLVEPLRGWLGEWIDAVGYHHENWDGSGYPRGTAGEAIPLAGRIVAIADVYDVITSVRSYKEAATPAEARAELVRCSGTQFDPRLVRAFVEHLARADAPPRRSTGVAVECPAAHPPAAHAVARRDDRRCRRARDGGDCEPRRRRAAEVVTPTQRRSRFSTCARGAPSCRTI